MEIVVIGCGALGARLASILSKRSHTVTVVERSHAALGYLDNDFSGLVVEGELMDLETLQSAGIQNCDAVAVVTSDDNLNVVLAQIAKETFGRQRVVARVGNPARESVFEQAGLTTVCPTKTAAELVCNLLEGELCDQAVSFGRHSAVFRTLRPEGMAGTPIGRLPLPEGALLYGVVLSDGRMELASNPSRPLAAGDTVIYSILAD